MDVSTKTPGIEVVIAHAKIPLKIQKLSHFKGEMPRYESSGASGFDVRAQMAESLTLAPGHRALIDTGLAFEIPHGYELQARPRSGLAIRQGLGFVNSPGTIDADYRGEVKFIAINLGSEPITIQDQDRVGQLVLCPILQADFLIVADLAGSDRGTGGFGSTGFQEVSKK